MNTGTILVTGASGFVGKWTVLELLRAGFSVRGTVRRLDKVPAIHAAIVSQLGNEPLSRFTHVQADLMDDTGWPEALVGVDAVCHVAAQIVAEEPRNADVVIRPAVEGTERVLRHAHAAGVRRVVMTSSIATVAYGHGHERGRRVYDETHFTQLDRMRFTWAYCIGKTRAEQAAWTFARANDMALTTIHPGAILGPALDDDASISLLMVSDLLNGKTPAMPSNGFSIIDVRDVAAMHVAALRNEASIGERYLAAGDYTPFPEVGQILREAYPDRTITQKIVPDWIIRILARFGGPTRQIINDIGNEKHFDRTKGEELLGRPLRSSKEAILAAAESSIALGLVKADQVAERAQ